jgi:hypothetical protein
MQKIDHNIGWLEKRQFCLENWGKLLKIVIISSTPGSGPHLLTFVYFSHLSRYRRATALPKYAKLRLG